MIRCDGSDGAKPGLGYGEMGDFSYDITKVGAHPTILRLLGVDHERPTYFHQGRRFRLTDVHGKVVEVLIPELE